MLRILSSLELIARLHFSSLVGGGGGGGGSSDLSLTIASFSFPSSDSQSESCAPYLLRCETLCDLIRHLDARMNKHDMLMIEKDETVAKLDTLSAKLRHLVIQSKQMEEHFN
ncbi:hypothetical protein Ancab_034605 [Ancistrocladus abbreviatus]